MLVCRALGRRRPGQGVRRASTTLKGVKYDPDTHVISSRLSVEVPDATVSEFVWRDANKWEHLPALVR